MGYGLLYDQALSIFGDFFDQNRFHVTQMREGNAFDLRMMVVESSSLKIRFTLERGLVTLAVGSLTAPNDWSRDTWFDIYLLLEYQKQRKSNPLRTLLTSTKVWITKRRTALTDSRSVVYEVYDDEVSIKNQLLALKTTVLDSYDGVLGLLENPDISFNMAKLQKFREERSEAYLNRLLRGLKS